MLQKAGELAGYLAEEVAMSGKRDNPEGVGLDDTGAGVPSVPSGEPSSTIGGKAGLGSKVLSGIKTGTKKSMGSVAKDTGSAISKGVVQGAKKKLSAFGINFSNELNLSNTPSSHRITRSPGNQILFKLRQKRGRYLWQR